MPVENWRRKRGREGGGRTEHGMRLYGFGWRNGLPQRLDYPLIVALASRGQRASRSAHLGRESPSPGRWHRLLLG